MRGALLIMVLVGMVGALMLSSRQAEQAPLPPSPAPVKEPSGREPAGVAGQVDCEQTLAAAVRAADLALVSDPDLSAAELRVQVSRDVPGASRPLRRGGVHITVTRGGQVALCAGSAPVLCRASWPGRGSSADGQGSSLGQARRRAVAALD